METNDSGMDNTKVRCVEKLWTMVVVTTLCETQLVKDNNVNDERIGLKTCRNIEIHKI